VERAAAAITGFSSAEAIGQPCYQVFRADICREACALRQTMATGAEQINVHVQIRSRHGVSKPISVSTAVLRDSAAGEIVGGVETFRDLSALETLRRRLQDKHTFHDIIGKNRRMKELFYILPDIAQADSTVLIQGPTGSGKELFASALHSLSHRAHKPFVPVNCAAFPETLLESELFGYRQGAFTDARATSGALRPGRRRHTVSGRDRRDAALAASQAAARAPAEGLRAARRYLARAGNVRIIAAVNRDLSKLMAEGRVREDLYYRLNVIALHIPPLCDRREDIPLLVDHFIQRFNAEKGREIEGITHEALALLMAHDYPGNVRELENIIEHAVVLSRTPFISRESLPLALQAAGPGPSTLLASRASMRARCSVPRQTRFVARSRASRAIASGPRPRSACTRPP